MKYSLNDKRTQEHSRVRHHRVSPRMIGSFLLLVFLLSASFPFVGERKHSQAYAASTSLYPLKNLPLLKMMLRALEKRYVDPTQFKPETMVRGALRRLEREFSDVWVQGGPKDKVLTVHLGAHKTTVKLGNFIGLLDVWITLRPLAGWLEKHYTGTRSILELEYALVNGVMGTLDKQTGITSLLQILRRRKRRGIAYSGKIGVTVSYKNKRFLITSVLRNGPADLAGLKAGDRILKVDGKVVKGGTVLTWVRKVTGIRGSRVRLLVTRKSWKKPKEVLLRRSQVRAPLVVGHLLPGKVGYVRLRQFARGASLLIRAELARLRARSGGNLLGLVLDLRNNPGGLVTEAVKICSMFVEEGLVVSFAGANIKRRNHKVLPGDREERYPLVVLLNGRSASASELLSSALQQHNRALLLGQQSYGKGTVQISGRIRKDVFFRVTIAQYVGPNDVSVQGKGVTPDVELFPVVLEKKYIHYFGWKLGDLAKRKKRWPKFLQQNLSDKRTLFASIPYLVKSATSKPKKRWNPKRWMFLEEPGNLDVQVWFARYLISNSTMGRRDLFFKQVKPAIRRFQKLQLRQITKRLKKLNINWTVPRKPVQTTQPKLKLSFGWGKAKAPFVPGKTYTLQVRVTNPGTKPVFRVRAMMFSRLSSLRHLEWLFGRIAPGKTVSLSRSIRFPSGIRSQVLLLKTHLHTAHSDKPQVFRTLLHLKASVRPRYAIQWWFHDPAPDGNGDGQFQPGERGTLRFVVENRSKGDAKQLKVALRLPGMRVLKKGARQTLGPLKAGERRFFDVHVRLKEKVRRQVSRGMVFLFDRSTASSLLYRPVLRFVRSHLLLWKQKKISVVSLQKAVRIKVAPTLQARTLFRLPKGRTLRRVRQWKQWSQVVVPVSLQGKVFAKQKVDGSTRFAWVPTSSLKTTGATSANNRGATLGFDFVAPEIRLLSVKDQLSRQKKIKLKLALRSDSALHSVYLRQGKSKIFYRHLKDKKKLLTNTTLEIPVNLKQGRNAFLLSLKTSKGRFLQSFYLSFFP